MGRKPQELFIEITSHFDYANEAMASLLPGVEAVSLKPGTGRQSRDVNVWQCPDRKKLAQVGRELNKKGMTFRAWSRREIGENLLPVSVAKVLKTKTRPKLQLLHLPSKSVMRRVGVTKGDFKKK